MFKNLKTDQYKWRFVEEEMSQTNFSEITKSQVTQSEGFTQISFGRYPTDLSRGEQGMDLC